MLNNWGSNSRMDLIYALGDQGRVQIDDYHQNTGDKAYFAGHHYTDKSIGPPLLGLPVYVIFKGLVRFPPLASSPAAIAAQGRCRHWTRYTGDTTCRYLARRGQVIRPCIMRWR